MKKFMLSLIIILSATVITAQNNEYKVGHYYYEICDNTNEWLSTKGPYAKLTRTAETDLGYTDEDVVVPEEINIEGAVYSVRSVNMSSFNWMSNGQKLRLPSSIREITKDLKNAELIDESSFPAVLITFPSECIEYIEAYGLANVEPAYQSYEFFNSVKSVGANAFINSGFKSVYLGANLQTCAYNAFNHGAPSYISFSNNPECAKEFDSYCFNECNIKELIFPMAKTLTLGENVVTGCPSLKYVSFPAITSINVMISAKINNGQPLYLLSGNSSLKEIICKGPNPPEIILPKNKSDFEFHITDNEDCCILKVPEGYEQAFREHPIWGRFKHIVPDEETMSLKNVDNYIYDITKSASNWYKFDTAQAELIGNDFNGGYPDGEVNIPSQITVNSLNYPVGAVRLEAFNWINKNQKLILPNSVKVISNYFNETFQGYIEFPETIESLEGELFSYSTIESDLYLPNIKYITWRVFNRSNVEKIHLGSSIELIGSSAFAFSSLKELKFDDGKQNSLSLSRSSFWAVKNIKELKIPKRQKLHLSDGFMSECDNLERVVIPDMDVIDCKAAACHDVAMLARPCGMLISGCEKLAEIVCLGSVPPELTGIDETAKYDNHTGFWITDNMDQCLLKVPAGSEQAYRNHPIWGKFKTICGFENGDYTSISTVPAAEPTDATPVYYNLQGMKVTNPAKGQLYIRTTGSKTEKIVL